MKNSNTPHSFHLISCRRVMLLTFFAFILVSQAGKSQTLFTRTTFNAPYTPISIAGGATSSTATGDNANQTAIAIGFSFEYANIVYTTIGLSTNGVAWFDAVAPSVTAGNANMVTTTSPNQSLAPWFNNLIDDASSDILYQTQGAAGSRTFTIQYTNYPTYTGTPGSNVRMNCQVILYETTNIIEFRYGMLTVIGAQTTSGGAMIGIEWGTGGSGKFIDAVTGSSSVSHRMLSPLSGWPSYNFRFTPGTPDAISAGTYNVGVGQTYNSLTQAVADVNHRGISGAVTLNLTDAQYDTTVANGSNIFPIFVAPPNGDATNTLTISKAGTAATLAYRGSSISASGAGFGTGVGTTAIGHSSEPLLGVSASYTTISNLNLMTIGAPQTVEIGLAVFELFGDKGAQHDLFDKISIDLNHTHGDVYGIRSFSTTSPGGFPGTNSNNTFRDLNIKDCNFGFSLEGVNTATGPADEDNQIITSSCSAFNYIGDPAVPDDISTTSGVFGVNITGQKNFVVRNCIIQNITGTGSSGHINGIQVANSWGTNEISNNIIRTLRRSSTGLSSVYFLSGIRINWDNQVITFRIFNNSISNLLSSYTGVATAQTAVIGIYFPETGAGTVTSEIYNNSISLDGSTFANASSVCLSITSTTKAFQIKNNVFANFTGAQTGVANHGCFYTNTTNAYGSAGSLSDYNDLYLASSTNGYLGRATTTNYTTLAAWQAAMTVNPGTDANSQTGNPFFKNNVSDLHGTFQSVALEGTGTTPLAYITTDIDCETRTAPHDIGFDDFELCMPNGGTIFPASASVCATSNYVMSSEGYGTDPGTTYQWMVSTTPGGPYSNVTGGSGSTTSSYTTGSLNAGTFYYVLKATCAGLTTDLSNELVLTVNALPSATITPAGPTTFCSGGSVVLNAPVTANRAYQWKKGSNNVAGATSSSFTATSGGNYKVMVTNTLTGCSKTSSSTTVTVNPLPASSITPQGPTTFCAGGSVVLQANTGTGLTYKWKKGSNFISGETASAYTATTQGTYKVEVTDANGCLKLSPGVSVTVPCKEDGSIIKSSEPAVSIFPKPAISKLTISLSSNEDFEIEILNVAGEQMMREQNMNTIDVKALPAGLYFVKIATAGFVVTEKLVKQ